MKFKCPHCQQHIEADDDLGGITAECPDCMGSFVVPHAVSVKRVMTIKKPGAKMLSDQSAGALMPLDAVSSYVPSGRVEHPFRLVLWFPLVVVAAAISGVLGAVLAYIALFVSTILVRQILGPIPSGVVEVMVFLGLNAGYITGITALSAIACTNARNRNVITGFFYGLLAGLAMAVLFNLAWNSNPALRDQLGFSIYIGLAGQVFSGLIAGWLIVKSINDNVYCEVCHTYISKNYCKSYAEPIETIRALAHAGSTDSLKALRNVSDAEAQSAVGLGTCIYGCCGYLRFVHRVNVKNEKGQEVGTFVPVASGIADPKAVPVWTYILSD